nr:hypothetical protein [Tanacetum cinerariifolium]
LVRIGSKIVIIAFWKADGAFFKPNGITFHWWGDACNKKAMHGCPQIKKAFVMKTFICPTYLSSHAVPRHFPVLSNSARNFFWLQSFAKALRINWYSLPRVVCAIVTFLASKSGYASFPRDSGKELGKTCFRLTSITLFK